MKRNKGAPRRRQSIPVWTYDQAVKAVPYLTSVMQTVREYRIESQRHDREARRLAALPGRPDRSAIIAHQDALREAGLADRRFSEAVDELEAMGVYCLEPLRGEALIPFAHGDQLAWFVFDMFDSEPLRHWRYHTDPLETRRPIGQIEVDLRGDSVVV